MKKRFDISKKLLAVNSSSSLLAWMLKTLLLFGLQRYLLDRVSLEEYSLYPVMASVLMFVELLRQLLVGGVSRFIVEADVQGDSRRVTQITSTMFIVQTFSAVVILALGAAFTRYIDRVLDIDPRFVWDARLMLGVMILSFSFQLTTTSLEVGLYARQRFVLMSGLELGSVVLRILLIVAFFSLWSVRVLWITVAAETANVLVHLVRLVISGRLVPALRVRWKEIEWSRARELLAFSSWNFIQSVSYRIYTSFDPLILNRLGTPFDVTIYYIGSLFKRQIGTALARITAPLMPSLIGLHARHEHNRMRNAYYRYGRYYIWANLAVTLPLIIFRRELILLYIGRQYLAAATVMLLLFSANIINLGNNALPKMAIALGQLRPTALASVAVQAVNVGLTLYLVGVLKMGAIGSALGSFIVSLTLQPLTDLLIARRLLGIRPGRWLRQTLLPGIMPGAGATLAWLAIRWLDRPDTWLELILYSIAGGLVYLPLVLLFFQPGEREGLHRVWVRLLGRRETL